MLDADTVREGLAELAPMDAAAAVMRTCPKTDFARVAVLEVALYMRNQLLRDAAWASMAHSLEIRVPLVDAFLLKQAAPYLVNARHRPVKMPLARAPAQPLPDEMVQRRKTGFVPALPGCISEGDNKDEAIKNVQEAIALYLESVEDDHSFAPEAEHFDIAL